MTRASHPPLASTGIAGLDAALQSLLWGDNVVLESDEGSDLEPFYRAAVSRAEDYDNLVFVALASDPAGIAARFGDGLRVLDARAGGSYHGVDDLLAAVKGLCSPDRRDLLLFDPLEALVERVGVEAAGAFFARCCPALLDLRAIAYWSLDAAAPVGLRSAIAEITQCIIVVGDARLRIAKAEGRPPAVQGTVLRWELVDGRPVVEPAAAASRLGAALRALRAQTGMSQSDLARIAGVSPSAMSQAERGQRGLSLDTLLVLTAGLDMTLDELLRGEAVPGYRLARATDARHAPAGVPLPLFDDVRTGPRAYLLRIEPEGAVESAPEPHGGGIVAVADGLVQVLLRAGRPPGAARRRRAARRRERGQRLSQPGRPRSGAVLAAAGPVAPGCRLAPGRVAPPQPTDREPGMAIAQGPMTRDEVKRRAKEDGVEFFFAQFVDMHGKPNAKLDAGRRPRRPARPRAPASRASPPGRWARRRPRPTCSAMPDPASYTPVPFSPASRASPATSPSRASPGRTARARSCATPSTRAAGARLPAEDGHRARVLPGQGRRTGASSCSTTSTRSSSPATT